MCIDEIRPLLTSNWAKMVQPTCKTLCLICNLCLNCLIFNILQGDGGTCSQTQLRASVWFQSGNYWTAATTFTTTMTNVQSEAADLSGWPCPWPCMWADRSPGPYMLPYSAVTLDQFLVRDRDFASSAPSETPRISHLSWTSGHISWEGLFIEDKWLKRGRPRPWTSKDKDDV